MDKTEQLLRELTEANGISGHELDVRRIMARELKPLTNRVEHDKLGSVMGVKRGTADNPRVMVVGHMDEVGFMVREINPDGYIKFLPIGGWWGHVALGQRMKILTSKGPVLGVVGSKPPHILTPAEREKVIDPKEMFIDVGVGPKFDVKKKLGIKPGDPIVPDSKFTILGNPGMYMAKAFDNRMACAVVVDVLRNFKATKHPNTILGAASVQEEVGLRGAQTLSHIADPDLCIVVDTGIALDVPPETTKKTERLGGGPSILLLDFHMIPNTRLRDFIVQTAEQKKIPYHFSTMTGGSTDGGRIHISRAGVPTIVVGPPVRYVHSHNAIMNRADYDNTVKLITEVIKKLDKKTVDSFTSL
ncbi:MAG: M42 family metallopeptidase [Candidatus Zixiibacteriota bacterium]